MSLLVWMPCIENTHNQGLYNSIPTDNTTIDNNGKIGRCLKITNSINTGLPVSACNINETEVSMGGWFKFNKSEIQAIINTKTFDSTHTSMVGCMIGYNSYGGLGLSIGTNNIYNSGSFDSITCFSGIRETSQIVNTGIYTIPFDTWVHLFLVCDRQKLYLYVNGALYRSSNISAPVAVRTNDNFHINAGYVWGGNGPGASFPMRVNDVRIYDHALSPREVKEISKGLVLHYTLSDNSVQTFNNVYSYPTFNTSNDAGGWYHWGRTGHKGTYSQNTNKDYIYKKDQTYSHCVANGADATGEYLLYQSPTFDGGTRSLQCICKEENGLEINESIVYPSWNARSGGALDDKWTSIIPLRDNFYLCKCEGIQQDGSNNLIGFFVCKGCKVYFSEAYVENDRDICSDIFFSNDIVYDVSGYGNNGIINGALVNSNNTPKYQFSTIFDGNTASIKIPFNDMVKDRNYTISVWTYKLQIGTKGYQTILGGPGGFELEARDSSNTSPLFKILNWGGGTTPYEFDKWYHFCFVHTDTDSKLYINGELKITGTSASVPTGDYFIGAWQVATSQNYDGLMSDFRIYTTPLSADDVLALYNTPISLTSSGVLMTSGELTGA